MQQKSDIFHRTNKYVDSDDIKFTKAYLAKVWVNRIISFILFFSILFGGLFMLTKVNGNIVMINGERYTYESTNDIDVGNKIIFSGKEATFIEKSLATIGLNHATVGTVRKLPFGIYNDGKIKFALKNEEYAVECSSGSCVPGSVFIVHKDKIFGVVQEVK